MESVNGNLFYVQLTQNPEYRAIKLFKLHGTVSINKKEMDKYNIPHNTCESINQHPGERQYRAFTMDKTQLQANVI